MSDEKPVLHVLLIEDDRESLEALLETLPETVADCSIIWEPCDSFEDALQRVNRQRYDLVLTDIYRDRTSGQKNIAQGDVKAGEIIAQLIDRRFCPVIVFSDGTMPGNIELGPFVRFADKSVGNHEILARLEDLIATGVPGAARALHDEIDRLAGSYLWQFLKNNWEALSQNGLNKPAMLERILRRRAAIQLSRLDPEAGGSAEITHVEGAEFYIYPSVAGDVIRLGEIVSHRETGEFRVVLTPHCHLVVQPGDNVPRADYILTVRALPASDTIRKMHEPKNPWKGSSDEIQDKIRRRINSPADAMGRPAGRFWFLPGFLEIPDLYCDFLQMESVAYRILREDYTRVAVLDTPFAEALQSCFTGFYSAVGVPGLMPERFIHLAGAQDDAEAPSEGA